MGFSRTFDFASRVDLTKVNKRVVENLIKSGSMDTFGYRRRQLLAIMDRALDAAAQDQHDRMTGQLSLFGGDTRQSAAAIPIRTCRKSLRTKSCVLKRNSSDFTSRAIPLTRSARSFRP